ncbi:MAG: FAD-dependent oxidoreductase [Bacilli bacterium]|nr:FAD-dependent oxidoreductase [Bacilli bacterium]
MLDLIIIGAGTAGMTSALYALRSGKKVLLLEKENVGGQIAFSPRVENFPSIKQISGSDFSNNLFEQVIDLGAEFELENVTSISKEENIFKVTTEYNEYQSKAVVIATGVKHRHINIDGEEELSGNGVSYCAVCDGAFYKGEEVALIGDGNTALQYSILLSNYCKKVYVCTLFDKFFGDYSLVQTLKKKENVEIIQNISLKEFIGREKLQGLIFENTQTKEKFTLNVNAVFIAIGQVPDNKAFTNLVDLDKDGYVVADENLQTKTPGLFVAGDCRVKKVRQLTTAVNDGAVSAVNAVSYIDKNF